MSSLRINFRLSKCVDCMILKLVAIAALLFLLTACPAPGPDCVMADDWGGNLNAKVAIDPSKEWTDSGIDAIAGEPLYIQTVGHIDLCPDNITLSTSSSPAIVPTVNRWQDTKFSVIKGSTFQINVLNNTTECSTCGQGEATSRGTGIHSSHYFDRRGVELQNGIGLYALILPPGQTPGPVEENEWFFPNNSATIDNNSTFFQLYENDPSHGAGRGSGIGGFSGQAPITGQVWLKYARTAIPGEGRPFVPSNSGSWEHRWSPWKGYFAWDDGVCGGACNPAVFGAACIASSYFFAPICIAAVTAGCNSGKWLPDQANCMWPSHNQWTMENYAENRGGYEINFSNTCPGSNGQYLEVVFAKDGDINSTPSPLFNGCSPGNAGCKPVVDKNGRPVTTNIYTVSNQDTLNRLLTGGINLYHGDNPQVNSLGEFQGQVPESGHVWFRIRDNIVKSSDYIATPAGCDMPTSPNYLSPDNSTPRGCVQKIPPADAINAPANRNSLQVCPKNYLNSTTGRVVSQTCDKSLLQRVTDQLSLSSNTSHSYIEQCGYRNPNCTPPVGFTGHDDNLGTYSVKIKTTKVDKTFSSTFNSIIIAVKGIIFGTCETNSNLNEVACGETSWQKGIVQKLYGKLIGTPETGGTPLSKMVRASILLYVIIYGFRFMLGVIEDAQREFITSIIRIAILQQMFSVSSWEFFNTYLFNTFINGINDFINILSAQFMGAGMTTLTDPVTGKVLTDATGATIPTTGQNINPFMFMDLTFSRFFTQETWIKIAGLLFGSFLGPAYMMLIIIGMGYYAMAVLVALIIYLLAMIGIGLQIVVAPIFISFMLFPRTRQFFSNWLKYTISYVAQPVFIFTALSIFNIFAYSAMYNVLHYNVCWQCLYSINFDDLFGTSNFFNADLCLFSFYMPWHNEGAGMPTQFFVMVIFMLLINAMYSFNEWMTYLASELAAGQISSSLYGAATSAMNKIAATAGRYAKTGINAGVGAGKAGFSAAKGAMSSKKDDNKSDDKKGDAKDKK